MTDNKDLKIAKDSVIAALAALSKASNDAALATAGFFQALDANVDTSKDIKDLAATLSILGASIKGVDGQLPNLIAELGNGKKPHQVKKKVERDPFAPKKPLTAFFAYSATVRDKIRAERAAKGEGSLSSVELTQIISQQWNALSEQQKEDWKKKYYDELVGYNEKFAQYKIEKENGTFIPPPAEAPPSSAPSSQDLKKEHNGDVVVEEKKKSKKRKAEEDGGKDKEKADEKKKEKKKDKKKKKSSE